MSVSKWSAFKMLSEKTNYSRTNSLINFNDVYCTLIFGLSYHQGLRIHICFRKHDSIGSEYGLSLVRCQVITLTSAGLSLIGLSVTLNLSITTVYSDADQRRHQSSASLVFVRGIHQRPVNSPHKWPVTRKMFPFDDVIMIKKEYFKWIKSRLKYIQ